MNCDDHKKRALKGIEKLVNNERQGSTVPISLFFYFITIIGQPQLLFCLNM